jgi:glutathione S-transferase
VASPELALQREGPLTLGELQTFPSHFKPIPDVWARGFGASIRLRYGLDKPGAADAARDGVARAFDDLERELGGGEYLVGDTFTVADLTAASPPARGRDRRGA